MDSLIPSRDDTDPAAMSRQRSKTSLTAVALAAGVTPAAASYALRNRPGVSAATREHVLKVAHELGYVPDPKLGSIMAAVRATQEKDLLPVAWFNNHTTDPNAWENELYLSPYIIGARARAKEMGYRIEVIWTHEAGMSTRRVSDLIYTRNLEGAVVTHKARRFRLNWNHLAGVALEGPLFSPQLPRVATDHFYNLQLAFKMIRRSGFRRIGVCLEKDIDLISNNAIESWVHFHNSTLPRTERTSPLFYKWSLAEEKSSAHAAVAKWLKRERPEVVICHNNLFVSWTEELGYRVPDDVGIVHLATDDDVEDWAGINSNRREVGAATIDLLVYRMQKRLFGLPKFPQYSSIRGEWHHGKTMKRLRQ